MQHKVLHADERSREVLSETLSNTVNTTKEESGTKDFIRGHQFFFNGLHDFGQLEDIEENAKRERAKSAVENFSGRNSTLTKKIILAGGQAVIGPIEELLQNILPDGISLKDLKNISVEKSIQIHYLKDEGTGKYYMQVYMGVKNITVHMTDDSYSTYYLDENGALLHSQNPSQKSTTYLAELNTTIELTEEEGHHYLEQGLIELEDAKAKFSVKKLNIALNHRQLSYNNQAFASTVKKFKLNKDTKHTEITGKTTVNKQRNSSNFLAGLITVLLSATGIGLIPLAAYAIKNGGVANAFRKFTSKFDKRKFNPKQKNRLVKLFKKDLQSKMPETYSDDSETMKALNLELNIVEDKKQRRQSVREIDGNWETSSTYASAFPPTDDSTSSADAAEAKPIEIDPEAEKERYLSVFSEDSEAEEDDVDEPVPAAEKQQWEEIDLNSSSNKK